MRAEQYVGRLVGLQQRKDTDMEELNRLRSLATSIPGSNLTGEIQGKGPAHSNVENIVMKIVDLENEIMDGVDVLIDYERQAWNVLSAINDSRQRTVLWHYYFCRRTVKEIAYKMRLSPRRVADLKNKGLLEADKILKNLFDAS